MASDKAFLDFILERLSLLEDVTYRPMMKEYILYYRGKVIGGIYDDRFLIKPTPSALRLMPDAESVPPYKGAKGMLAVSEVEDREFLKELFDAVYEELPEKKKRREVR
ncbi:MAG: competence protein TfoX [Erysipelotrichaceae bacterium]|nr:competence protein TfoX [Erysipelotrichaceae bacterium]